MFTLIMSIIENVQVGKGVSHLYIEHSFWPQNALREAVCLWVNFYLAMLWYCILSHVPRTFVFYNIMVLVMLAKSSGQPVKNNFKLLKFYFVWHRMYKRCNTKVRSDSVESLGMFWNSNVLPKTKHYNLKHSEWEDGPTISDLNVDLRLMSIYV